MFRIKTGDFSWEELDEMKAQIRVVDRIAKHLEEDVDTTNSDTDLGPDLTLKGLHLFAAVNHIGINPFSERESAMLLSMLDMPLIALLRLVSIRIKGWIDIDTYKKIRTRDLRYLCRASLAAAIEDRIMENGLGIIDDLLADRNTKLVERIFRDLTAKAKAIDANLNLFSAYMAMTERERGNDFTFRDTVRGFMLMFSSRPTWSIAANTFMVYRFWSELGCSAADLLQMHRDYPTKDDARKGISDLTKFDWYQDVEGRISAYIPKVRDVFSKKQNDVCQAAACFRNAAQLADSELLAAIQKQPLLPPHFATLSIAQDVQGSIDKIKQEASQKTSRSVEQGEFSALD